MLCNICNNNMVHNGGCQVFVCGNCECQQQYFHRISVWRIPTIHSETRGIQHKGWAVRFYIDGVFHDELTYFIRDPVNTNAIRDAAVKDLRVRLRRW